MMKHLMPGVLLCVMLQSGCPAFSAELRFAGLLGQSSEKPPLLSEVACGGVAADENHTLFFRNGTVLYRIVPETGEPEALLSGVSGKVTGDARDVYLWRDGRYLDRLLKREGGKYALEKKIDLGRAFGSVCLIPEAMRRRWQNGKRILALDAGRRKIYAFDGEGRNGTLFLDLAAFADGKKSPLLAVGVFPRRDWILVSTGYPDSKVYRFDLKGRVLNGGIWPLQCGAKAFSMQNGEVWAVWAQATKIEESMEEGARLRIGGDNDMFTESVAKDLSGAWYLATSSGLKYYSPPMPNHCMRRLGGAGKPLALACAHGKVLFARGCELNMLALDSFPDEPLESNGHVSWILGRDWSSRTAAALPDGGNFLLLDAAGGRVIRFDPAAGPNDAGRFKILEQGLKDLSDMAFADGKLLIASGGKLNVPCDFGRKIERVAAFSADEFAVFGEGCLGYVAGGKTIWRKTLSCHDIEVMGENILAAGKQLLRLDRGGGIVQSLPYELHALAADGPYLVGADHACSALRLFLLD